MKKQILSLLFACFSASVCGAVVEPPPFKVEVFAEGVFEQPKEVNQVPAPATAAGVIGEYGSPLKHVASNLEFKAAVGLTFGFRYRLMGLPAGAKLQFEMRAIHPPMRGADGGVTELSSAPIDVYAKDGRYEDDLVYSLTEPFEVVPGRWYLQLYFKGRPIASRAFLLK